MTIPFDDVHAEMMRDPEYRAAYDESGPRMELAFAMAEARAKAGLTQAQVAQRMKSSQARVSRLERGAERPNAATLEKYAAATGARLEIRLIPAGAAA